MKIKVTKEIKELEGNLEEKVATPFGNSAHINVGKKHTGKVLSIIEPANPDYKWVLPPRVLVTVLSECKQILSQDTGRLVFLKMKAVNSLGGTFKIEDLSKVLDILKKKKSNHKLIMLIKKTYNL